MKSTGFLVSIVQYTYAITFTWNTEVYAEYLLKVKQIAWTWKKFQMN